MEGISLLNSSPLLGTPRKLHRVREVLYRDTAHNLGAETDTGVTYVRMDMEEDDASLVGKGMGQESDHTGMEIDGGGGGMALFGGW